MRLRVAQLMPGLNSTVRGVQRVFLGGPVFGVLPLSNICKNI